MPNEEYVEKLSEEAKEELQEETRNVKVATGEDFARKLKELSGELDEVKEQLKKEKESKVVEKVNKYKENHRRNTFTISNGKRPVNKPRVSPPAKKFGDKGSEAVLGERRGAYKIWEDRPVKNT